VVGLRRALVAIGLAGIVCGLVYLELMLASRHIADKWLAASLGLFIGWSFIGTGLFAWWRRASSRFGALMVAVGFAFFASGLAAANASGLFTIGLMLSSLSFGICAHMLLAFPGGQVATRFQRRLVGLIYVLCLVGPLPTLLAGDFVHHRCDCPESAIRVADLETTVRVIDVTIDVLGIAAVLTVTWILLGRWRAASGAKRRALAPVLWAGVALTLLLGGLLASDALRIEGLVEGFDNAGSVAFASVPYAFLVGLVRSRVSRAGTVADLLTTLRDELGSGDLRDLLAEALGDPSLELAYRLDAPERVVDGQGRPIELPRDDHPARAATAVELDGLRVGAIVHDRALCDEPELLETVAAAAGLAMQNGRLQAELRARVSELRASRARLIEAGVAERRRLERNLHDGAQQRLVALSLSLRLARARLHEAPEAAEALLWSAQEELTLALAELRELARGQSIPPSLRTAASPPRSRRSRAVAQSPSIEPAEGRLPSRRGGGLLRRGEGAANVAKYAHATARRSRRSTAAASRCRGRRRRHRRRDPRGQGCTGLADRRAALDGV
jgi:signal transduction histidine kinase